LQPKSQSFSAADENIAVYPDTFVVVIKVYHVRWVKWFSKRILMMETNINKLSLVM